jgi:hypothetical protein
MPKKRFKVYLSAVAAVETSLVVSATSKKAAEKLALLEAKRGDAVWEYDGVDDGTVVVNEVQDAL